MALLLTTPPALLREGGYVRITVPSGRGEFLVPIQVLADFCASADADILRAWRAERPHAVPDSP